jgi:negative regulator of sigma-B (phosphoserine phosphatase)
MGDRSRSRGSITWGVAAAPLPGQQSSGDSHLVLIHPGGALVVAVDALGHGPEAERAALRAVALFAETPAVPIAEQLRRCHQALLGDRGVVVSLASFDVANGIMTWAGVGNVEAVLVRPNDGRPASRSGLVVIGGVVGGDLPEVRPQQLPVAPGDVVVFATDGVRRDFVDAVDPLAPPEGLAADLLARFAKGTDDALVLAIRYEGPVP